MSREMFCKKHPVGETYPGEISKRRGLRRTHKQGYIQTVPQHEATPELNNNVSNDTMPKNVLIYHDSALYCDNTEHEQMIFCLPSAVFPPMISASVFPPMTLQNLTTRPRLADLKK